MAIAAPALVGSLLAGCAGQNGAASLTPESLPRTVQAALDGVRSVHVNEVTTFADSENGNWTITVDTDLVLHRNGDIDAHAVYRMEHPSVELPEAEIIWIDGELYVKGDPTSRPDNAPTPTPTPTPTPVPTDDPTAGEAEAPWVRMDTDGDAEAEDQPASAILDAITQLDPEKLAAVQRESILAVDIAGPRLVVDGVPTTPYTVIVGTAFVKDLLSSIEPDGDELDIEELLPEAIIYDYWLGDDGLPIRVRFGLGGITQETRFSAWNTPVQITVPVVEDPT